MFTRQFIADATERAIKTFAQTFLVVAGLSNTGLSVISVNWLAGVQVGLYAALASLLTSVISAKSTNSDSASLSKAVNKK
jgi:hypothetical protein